VNALSRVSVNQSFASVRDQDDGRTCQRVWNVRAMLALTYVLLHQSVTRACIQGHVPLIVLGILLGPRSGR
jgi:hypothetical protein